MHIHRYFNYSCQLGDFDVFTLQGWIVAPFGVKFGAEERLHAKFHPDRCRGGASAPKFWNINSQQVRIPWAIFTKFLSFVGTVMVGHVLKFGWVDELIVDSVWGREK